MEKIWHIAPHIPAIVDKALVEFPEPIRQVLFNRGCKTKDEAWAYLNGTEPEGDPFLLTDMDKAVSRLVTAINKKEKIAVYGDYDVDGVTATALLVEIFGLLGGDATPYIPNRFDEGYGLNNDALDTLSAQNIQVVVTVDCGIRSSQEAEHALELGIDLIITDHHHPREILPHACAVICQKRDKDRYPNKNIAGVGIAYKLAEALLTYFPHVPINIRDWLDLVALGTVADVVPLVDENRCLVKAGLIRLQKGKRLGLNALAGVSRISLERITAGDIGFMLGPRLNAAGRLESAQDALALLLAQDAEEAGRLALKLDNQNRERQNITREMQTQAIEKAGVREDSFFIFFADPSFNSGVVGLTAARLTEMYYRPTAIGSIDLASGTTRCSCRSIPEFHITNALDECANLLIRHGGHAMAAGFTVSNENKTELIERLQHIASRQLATQELHPKLEVDVEIPLHKVTPDLLPYLAHIQPTGMGNPDVTFKSCNLKVTQSKLVGAEGTHLKLSVSDGHIHYDCIGFRQGHWFGKLPERIDIAFTFEVNEFNGNRNLQLNIKDLRPAQV